MTTETYRAGFDVGGTNARVHLFDGDHRPVGGLRRRIREASAPRQIADTLVEMLAKTCGDHDVSLGTVDAVGIGLAGQLSADRRIVKNAPNLAWRDVDFVDHFADAWSADTDTGDVPSIQLINDLSAQLLGEYLDGAVAGIDDVLAVYVGTGIGGAILADGRLVTGTSNNAGEIGHSKVVVGGRPCGCGENGCVEAYAGGIHLERIVAGLVDDTGDELADLETDQGIDLSAADELVASHHHIGDIWEEATDFLSLVIANAVTLLNPKALLIGGGVFDNCHNFRAMTLQKTVPIVLEVARQELEIARAESGDMAGMLGAAALAARD